MGHLSRLPSSTKPIVVVAMLMVAALTAAPHRCMADVMAADVMAADVVVEYLSAPMSVFTDTLKSTIDGVLEVASMVARFAGMFGEDFRVSNAINDCLDLLDLSSQELDWSLYASQYGILFLPLAL